MRHDPDCLFCKVVKGAVPSAMVYEDDAVLAFRDINPAAPTHVLVVPKDHVAKLSACGDGDRDLLAAVMLAAGKVAELEKLDSFRLIVNNGTGAGQTVFHLHAHVLGGKPMGERLL
jgi:histidine triad (HIT) family protein